jgi:hypothetical protein
MESKPIIFAGVEISSGRKPITFAALGEEMEVTLLAQWGVSDAVSCLTEYESAQLVINTPSSKAGHAVYSDFRSKIVHAGFKPFSRKNSTRQWLEANAQDCYRAIQSGLLPRRTLEGRIQRALILYEEGLQINDPMDYFEEITRHKLMQGILPSENIYSARQLDALIAAYVAWMAENRSERVLIKDNLILPAQE